jgi:hypothetical protein
VWTIAIAMLVILVISGLIVTYVAFPHRGEEVPGAPWLGDALSKANEALPKIQDGELDEERAALPAEEPADRPADETRGQGFGRAS